MAPRATAHGQIAEFQPAQGIAGVDGVDHAILDRLSVADLLQTDELGEGVQIEDARISSAAAAPRRRRRAPRARQAPRRVPAIDVVLSPSRREELGEELFLLLALLAPRRAEERDVESTQRLAERADFVPIGVIVRARRALRLRGATRARGELDVVLARVSRLARARARAEIDRERHRGVECGFELSSRGDARGTLRRARRAFASARERERP